MVGVRPRPEESDGLRPVPRAAGGAVRRGADLRADLHVADRGGRGDQLVSPAPRGRARPAGAGDYVRLPWGGDQALLDGPGVPAAPHAAVAGHRAERLAGHRWVAGDAVMDHLQRRHAPITDDVWAVLDDESRERLTPVLAVRRLVDFRGPAGWRR